MIYNIDTYNISLYSEFIKNASERGIEVNEYVSVRDFRWYVETEREPLFLTFFEAKSVSKRFLVAKTKGVNQQDIYNYRRTKVAKDKSNLDLCKNDAFNFFEDSDDYFFINIKNREFAESLSREVGRLYFMGSYMKNKFKIYLTNNQHVSNFIPLDNILVGGDTCFNAEIKLNYEIFLLKDRLKKFSQTPYIEDGKTIFPQYTHPFFKVNFT